METTISVKQVFEYFEVLGVFLIVFQQGIEGFLIVIIDETPPQSHGMVAIDPGQTSLDPKHNLNFFQTAAQALTVTTMHQVAMNKTLFNQIDTQSCPDVGKVKPLAIESVDGFNTSKGFQQSCRCHLVADQLNKFLSFALSAVYADDGDRAVLGGQARGLNIKEGFAVFGHFRFHYIKLAAREISHP